MNVSYVTVDQGVIRVGDHVKQWFWSDDRIVRIDEIRVARSGMVIAFGYRPSDNALCSIPVQTNGTSLIVVFRPMSDQEVFLCSESIARGHECTECGAMWVNHCLDHRDGCRYIRTLGR